MSTPDHCPTCNALLAADQRYCLNCGTRLAQPRVDFGAALGLQPAPAAAVVRPGRRDQRMSLVNVLSGLAAVLLALGVGIVIGRGNGTSAPQKAQVVTLSGVTAPTAESAAPGSGAATPATSISDDWPSSTSAYTVEVSSMAKAGATAAALAAAKSAAASKGATAVGVLNGDAHAGTPTGKYVIYSGRYSTKQQATAAAAKLQTSFPGALVLHVTPSGSGSSSSGSGSPNASASNAGAAAAASLAGKSGSAYSKASAKLPKVVGTGGAPPPTDNKKAGGGTSATCIGC